MVLIPTHDTWQSPFLKGLDAEKPNEWGTSAPIAFYWATDTSTLYCATRPSSGAPSWVNTASGAAPSAWGTITGTLASQTDLAAALAAKVPTSRTVNGEALSSDVTLGAADVGAVPLGVNRTAYIPVLAFATPPTTLTYTTQVGEYATFGPLTYFQSRVVINSPGSGGSGAMSVSLPVASLNVANVDTIVAVNLSSNSNFVSARGRIQPNLSRVDIAGRTAAASADSAVNYSDMAAASFVEASGFYFTS